MAKTHACDDPSSRGGGEGRPPAQCLLPPSAVRTSTCSQQKKLFECEQSCSSSRLIFFFDHHLRQFSAITDSISATHHKTKSALLLLRLNLRSSCHLIHIITVKFFNFSNMTASRSSPPCHGHHHQNRGHHIVHHPWIIYVHVLSKARRHASPNRNRSPTRGHTTSGTKQTMDMYEALDTW